MYLSQWPCLRALDLVGSRHDGQSLSYPFSAPEASYFYLARNGIFHLCRALGFAPRETMLVPNYHSGHEMDAVEAAGIQMRYYRIQRDLQPDFDSLERACGPETRALYVIHFMGWPQPMKEITDFCRARGLLLIEDCALAMFSESGGTPLGAFGDYSVFCLYKTLPVPNGGMLVQNSTVLPELARLPLNPPDRVSVSGRMAELLLEWLQSRWDFPGRVLKTLKQAAGATLTGMGRERVKVGSSGFEIEKVNIGIAPISLSLLKRFNGREIRDSRRANYSWLEKRLPRANRLPLSLDEGVCPLFFPFLVEDKHRAAQALWSRGIGAVELWNDGHPHPRIEGDEDELFLRRHVLELPIHQNITEPQLEYMARQISDLRDVLRPPCSEPAVVSVM